MKTGEQIARSADFTPEPKQRRRHMRAEFPGYEIGDDVRSKTEAFMSTQRDRNLDERSLHAGRLHARSSQHCRVDERGNRWTVSQTASMESADAGNPATDSATWNDWLGGGNVHAGSPWNLPEQPTTPESKDGSRRSARRTT